MMSLIEDVFINSKAALLLLLFTQRCRSLTTAVKAQTTLRKAEDKPAKVLDRIEPQIIFTNMVLLFYISLVTKQL